MMDTKTIDTHIKKLQSKRYDNMLRDRAKKNRYTRIFISHRDDKVHLIQQPDSSHLYYYYQFLCIEDTVGEPDGVLIDSSISLTKGSYYFDEKYNPSKLCQKCFKYVKPSSVLRLEAQRKRQKGQNAITQAEKDNKYLLDIAIVLEKNADGLDNGSIQVNLKENEELD